VALAPVRPERVMEPNRQPRSWLMAPRR
jgi:hypothetical protein